ncbi:hypothetical protein PRZ48_003064 [Zasmidium cellare]|uniref:Uncharacterized protein n=1 Tax=Zasmidium cellare TaxID=395010 RepID=A0ABR0EVI3_ZASCE|nr:hypothetical protein PRZ48_003064 [Zasmidium cellare]
MPTKTSTMEEIIESLPTYVTTNDKASKKSTLGSRLVVIQDEAADTRQPAIAMSQELVEAIIASLKVGIETVYQFELAKAKKAVISSFEEWASMELNKLWMQCQETGGSAEERERFNTLNEQLQLADEQKMAIDAQTRASKLTAFKATLGFSGHLDCLFADNNLVDLQEERFDNLKPDEAFLEQWRIPEPEDHQEHPDHQQYRDSHQDDANNDVPPSYSSRTQWRDDKRGRSAERRSRSSSPRRDLSHHRNSLQEGYRSRSPGTHRTRSPNHPRDDSPLRRQTYDKSDRASASRARKTTPSQTGPNPYDYGSDYACNSEYGFLDQRPPPKEMARLDFCKHARRLREAQLTFDHRHNGFVPAHHFGDNVHPFQLFMEFNQDQIKAEERFRAARQRCHELGVDILYEDQTSFFTEGPDVLKKEIPAMADFIGPANNPVVQAWLDDEVHSAAGVDGAEQAAPQPEDPDDWSLQGRRDWNDSCSAVDWGRGKVRIQTAQAAERDLREEAIKHWARTMGASTEDWNARHWG